MAVQIITVTLAAESTKNFVFNKPAGNYGKSVGLTVTDGGGGAAPFFRNADTDNGDGTMTGHLELTGAVGAKAEIEIWDKS